MAITPAAVSMGLDTCAITGVTLQGGDPRLSLQCKSSEEGGDYAVVHAFAVRSGGAALAVIHDDGGATEYVRCDQ